MKDKTTNQSRGFGFVKFKDPNCVGTVLASRPHTLDGRNVSCFCVVVFFFFPCTEFKDLVSILPPHLQSVRVNLLVGLNYYCKAALTP